MRLLLVEDNERLAGLIAAALDKDGFTVDTVGTLDEAAGLRAADHRAIILDLALPDGDGLSFLRQVRAAGNATPILIISARERLDDRLAGLNAGADDYLAKPFAVAELQARLRAILRRPPTMAADHLILANLAMDEGSQEATVDGQRLDMPRRERAVLRLLLRTPGRLVLRSTIDNAVFGFDAEVGGNALEVYISRLRKRLKQAGARANIRTDKGLGYAIDAEAGDG